MVDNPFFYMTMCLAQRILWDKERLLLLPADQPERVQHHQGLHDTAEADVGNL
jgi:hypothetical protein